MREVCCLSLSKPRLLESNKRWSAARREEVLVLSKADECWKDLGRMAYFTLEAHAASCCISIMFYFIAYKKDRSSVSSAWFSLDVLEASDPGHRELEGKVLVRTHARLPARAQRTVGGSILA